MKKKAFTLAEIMIVLTIIGVLTAILLPAARNAMPNKKVMKFKKAHNTLTAVIQELVNSDKYYLNGDLAIKADGQTLHHADEKNHSYFISTFADVLSVNYISPKVGATGISPWFTIMEKTHSSSILKEILNHYAVNPSEITTARIDTAKQGLMTCNKSLPSDAKQIITSNGIWYWDLYPECTFGITEKNDGTGRIFLYLSDRNGLISAYKIFCMDIDGVPENATATDCVNECPFSYGIRVDGKIFTSGRVDEWLEKSIQDKE